MTQRFGRGRRSEFQRKNGVSFLVFSLSIYYIFWRGEMVMSWGEKFLLDFALCLFHSAFCNFRTSSLFLHFSFANLCLLLFSLPAFMATFPPPRLSGNSLPLSVSLFCSSTLSVPAPFRPLALLPPPTPPSSPSHSLSLPLPRPHPPPPTPPSSPSCRKSCLRPAPQTSSRPAGHGGRALRMNRIITDGNQLSCEDN